MTPAEFERATGWEIKAEGACRGDVCVPLDDGDFHAPAVAERLGMAVVHDPELGLRRGRARDTGRTVVDDDRRVGLQSLRPRRPSLPALLPPGSEGAPGRLGPLLRLSLGPARVAGTEGRAAPRRPRSGGRLPGDGRPRGGQSVVEAAAVHPSVADRPDPRDGRPFRRDEHPPGHLDRRVGDDRPAARAGRCPCRSARTPYAWSTSSAAWSERERYVDQGRGLGREAVRRTAGTPSRPTR